MRSMPSFRAARRAAALIATATCTLQAVGLAAQETSGPAQAPPVREGFHFSIGVGAAAVSASCPGCDVRFIEERTSGLAGQLQMGGAITSRLTIAAQFAGWLRNDEVFNRRMASLSVVLLGYPSESSGFFIKGGVGGLAAVAETDAVYAEVQAFSSETGVGYDISIGETASATPYVSYIRTFGGTTWVDGFEVPVEVLPDAFRVGVALTVH